MRKRVKQGRGWLGSVLAGLGAAGACTVADKADYAFDDTPGETGGQAGEGVSTGGSTSGGSGGTGGATSGSGGSAGEGGDGDPGGAGGTGGTTGGSSGGGGDAGGGGDDPCDPNPCVNGTCTAAGNDFECRCESGWDGTICDENIDDCDPNPCQANAPCMDLVDDFECSCPNALTGKTCDIPRFELLGPLPERSSSGVARAVNALGIVVVGWYKNSSNADRPFRWTRLEGAIPVATPTGAVADAMVRPYAITNDGSGWVGEFNMGAMSAAPFPFRGSRDSAAPLPAIPNALGGAAFDVSGDGTRAVGYFTESGMGNPVRAVYWDDTGTEARPLPNPFSGSLYSVAGAITRNGTIMGGVVKDATNVPHLVIWPNGGNPPGTTRLPQAAEVEVFGLSADGMTGVGTFYDTAFANFAFVSSQANGFVNLAPMLGATLAHSRAYDVSDDGSVIVGEAAIEVSGTAQIEAFVWLTPRPPGEPLALLLERNGVPLPMGFRLVRAYGVSANGKVIVGEAANDALMETQPFIVRLP